MVLYDACLPYKQAVSRAPLVVPFASASRQMRGLIAKCDLVGMYEGIVRGFDLGVPLGNLPDGANALMWAVRRRMYASAAAAAPAACCTDAEWPCARGACWSQAELACIRLLVYSESALDAVDCGGFSALHHAALRGDLAVMEMLVAAGADKDHSVCAPAGSPLAAACAFEEPAAVGLLLALGCDTRHVEVTDGGVLRAFQVGVRRVQRVRVRACERLRLTQAAPGAPCAGCLEVCGLPREVRAVPRLAGPPRQPSSARLAQQDLQPGARRCAAALPSAARSAPCRTFCKLSLRRHGHGHICPRRRSCRRGRRPGLGARGGAVMPTAM